MRYILLITFLFLSVPAGADQMYKWVDEDGTVHFSDRKPASGAERVELDPLNVSDPVDVKIYHQGGSTNRAQRNRSVGARVTMYSTSVPRRRWPHSASPEGSPPDSPAPRCSS